MTTKLAFTMLAVVLSAHLAAQDRSQKNWVDSVGDYKDSNGNSISITNSLPKGGGNYTDKSGNIYSYVIFWHNIRNTSEIPLELKMTFPVEDFAIFPSPKSHIRLLLPKEKMSSEKILQRDYGLTSLNSFLDTEFNKPNFIEKTLNVNEEYLFYVAVLIHEAQGTARASIEKQDEQLIYHISIHPNSVEIPLGKIIF